MLTYEDCVELSGLTNEEIEAIAEHEHVPNIVALELGHYLLETEAGVPAIKEIILDDIHEAEACANLVQSAKLKLVLQHFVSQHPYHEVGQ
ncbi:MAG: hypothetical protein ACPHPA_00400 [Cycloclasticus pugetii]|jgi:hypothetical protein|uniref:hypothetical protein n=1 Tax=Cycloclasticus TaxID=34067 RepID=UPI000286AAD0|nr:hypothetical protein [Cycloclasticus sp. P1]AFT66226.1 hypothetical protein Q91_0186 [Cycloclasticus sp. P1]